MKNENEQTNHAKVVGRVVKELKSSHEIDGEKFYEFTLEIKRLSETYDYIPVTISERILGKEKIKVGERIGVEGEFRSYNKQENDKSKLILHVFAKNLIREKELENIEDENQVVLLGYLCKEPIYRITPFNREICDALIAVNRKNFKSDYLPCIFWGRNARFMEKQIIGKRIGIEGRIQSRIYTKKYANGLEEEKVAYEISVAKLRDNETENEIIGKNEVYKNFLNDSYKEERVLGN